MQKKKKGRSLNRPCWVVIIFTLKDTLRNSWTPHASPVSGRFDVRAPVWFHTIALLLWIASDFKPFASWRFVRSLTSAVYRRRTAPQEAPPSTPPADLQLRRVPSVILPNRGNAFCCNLSCWFVESCCAELLPRQRLSGSVVSASTTRLEEMKKAHCSNWSDATFRWHASMRFILL